VSWDFQIGKPGTFAVEILQGCGNGSGGSEVMLSTGDQLSPLWCRRLAGFKFHYAADREVQFREGGALHLVGESKEQAGTSSHGFAAGLAATGSG